MVGKRELHQMVVTAVVVHTVAGDINDFGEMLHLLDLLPQPPFVMLIQLTLSIPKVPKLEKRVVVSTIVLVFTMEAHLWEWRVDQILLLYHLLHHHLHLFPLLLSHHLIQSVLR